MKTPCYCRHCGTILLVDGRPAEIPCKTCGTSRLYKLRLPPVVVAKMVRDQALREVANNVYRM